RGGPGRRHDADGDPRSERRAADGGVAGRRAGGHGGGRRLELDPQRPEDPAGDRRIDGRLSDANPRKKDVIRAAPETAPRPGSGAPPAALLTCGVVAGPLYLAVVLLQALTRTGFDLKRHPLSSLSLGHLGWIQIVNFVVTGLLVLACAAGMRRV